MTSYLFSCTPSSVYKGVNSERKEIAPKLNEFFLLRVELFSEMRQNNFDRFSALEVYLFPIKVYMIILLKSHISCMPGWI